MSKLRLALVGLGSIGRRHQRLLLERADVVVELIEPRVKLSKAKAEALTTRSEIEQQRVTVSAESAKAQVEQLRALYELHRCRVRTVLAAGLPPYSPQLNPLEHLW